MTLRLVILLVFYTTLSIGQNPSLDLNFASSGHFYHYSSLDFSGAPAIGIQSSGKMVIGGYEGVGSSLTMNGKLFRLLPNGELDSTFGVNGFVPDTIFTGTWSIWRLTVQPDDRIIIIGWADDLETGLIARFTANGILDTTFNNLGYRVIDLYPNLYASHSLYQVEVLQNGKILVLGDVDVNQIGREVFLLRFLANGQQDNSFGMNGIAKGFVDPIRDLYARDIVVDDNGSYFLGGTTLGGITDNPTILKVDSNGNTDLTFGTNGLLRFPSIAAWSVWSIFKLNQDELLLTSEESAPNGKRNLVTMKAFTNGFIDLTYGNNGVSKIDLENRGMFAIGSSATLLKDKSVIQTLSNIAGSFNRFALTRILPDGSIDSTFGNNGILLSNLPATSGYLNIQAIDSVSFLASGVWADSNSTAFLVSKYFLNSYLYQPEYVKDPVRVYPNPTSGVLHVFAKNQARVFVFNNVGKQVWSGSVDANVETQIDLRDLPNGVYFLKSAAGMFEKIVIQR